ncbi:conserved hypothetical protein [gamma proteobacterium NOR5-3]|nr:conserved hypothetical protein [gamma proteobacterium NOR5-3]
MVRYVTCSLMVITLVFSLSAAAQTTLDQLVTIERQQQLGLDRLTAQERAGVTRLLEEVYQDGINEGQSMSCEQGARGPQNPRNPSTVSSTIVGEFKGWQGNTVVRLANGQVWQQEKGQYYIHYAYQPAVFIYRVDGRYKMDVDGVDTAVWVRPLQ